MSKDYTTLLVKMPPELKDSFQALCKSRGAYMADELRWFMANEVIKATTGMSASDIERVRRTPTVTTKETSGSIDRSSSRCTDTADLFDDMLNKRSTPKTKPKKPTVARKPVSFDGIGVSHSNNETKSLGGKNSLADSIKRVVVADK